MLKNSIAVSVNFADKITVPLKKEDIAKIISRICSEENIPRGSIGVVFVGKDTIRALNVRYLNHDYETDVISFPLQEPGEHLDGEIYISAAVAREQARTYKTSFEEELLRLIAHGTLHLIGYDDTEAEKRRLMSEKEEYYLQRYNERIPAEKN